MQRDNPELLDILKVREMIHNRPTFLDQIVLKRQYYYLTEI
jgi:hypothetical protein